MIITEEQWYQHIDAWELTHSTQADYCRNNQLPPHQFSYWKNKRLKNNSKTVTSKFAIAHVETSSQITHSTLSMTLPNGIIIDGIDANNAHIIPQLVEGL